MADFIQALAGTLKYEGKYSNNPHDAGGETYRGVAREVHDDWHGWALIDAHKSDARFPGCLESSIELQEAVRAFYRAEFWDRLWLGRVSNQEIASELLEEATLLGPSRPVLHLQRLLNVLNRRGELWPDLLVDGDLKKKTLSAIETCLAKRPVTYLLRGLNALQLEYLIGRMEKRPANETFVGWFDRG